MKLTRDDSKGLVTWGAAGLAGGLLYSLTQVYIKQLCNINDLDPKTEALYEDQELFALFCQLQTFRQLDEKAFRFSVDNSDRLVFRRHQLQNQNIKVSLRDRPESFMFLKIAMSNLEKLLKTAKGHKDAKVPVKVHNLYLKIYDCLESHWKVVLQLTQEVNDYEI